jgi:hypothetical protein
MQIATIYPQDEVKAKTAALIKRKLQKKFIKIQ